MTNLKNWKKVGASHYDFYIQGHKIGTMEIQMNAFQRKALIEIEGEKFVLRRTGFWKSNLEIEDSMGVIVLKTYAEKWYANALTIAFDDQKLKLIIRNNPMAEYVILDHDKEILAYGLDTKDGKTTTRIQTFVQNKSYLLDFFLWYNFVSVAQENMGDDFTFLLMATA